MLNQRLDRLIDYPFQRLRELLADTPSPKGVEPRMLHLGEPRHAPPPMVADVIAAHSALWNRYPMVDGTPAFRDAAAGWLKRRYGLDDGCLDADRQILPLAGSREGLYVIASLVVPEGNAAARPAVLIPNPFYQVYVGAAVMAGAEPIFLPATRENGFMPEIAAAGRAVLDRTALVYLCSPSNPQGAVADIAYLKAAIELARRHDFVLAVDECYAEIYNDHPPPGALQACAALGSGFENVVVFHSLSKRSSVPGLRSGFVAGDAALIRKLGTLRNYASPTVPIPVLEASAALWRDDAHVQQNRQLYREKFETAGRLLGGRFGYARPAGGFFLWLEVGDGETAARKLWTEAGLRVLPGAYLGRGGAAGPNPGAAYVRIALVHDTETVRQALERLVKVL